MRFGTGRGGFSFHSPTCVQMAEVEKGAPVGSKPVWRALAQHECLQETELLLREAAAVFTKHQNIIITELQAAAFRKN